MKNSPGESQSNLPWPWIAAVIGIGFTGASIVGLWELNNDPTHYICVARPEDAITDLRGLTLALERYRAHHAGRYPARLEDLLATDAQGLPYLPDQVSLPLDPWHNPYFYEPPSSTTPLLLLSLGCDGQFGGHGDDADISYAPPPPR